ENIQELLNGMKEFSDQQEGVDVPRTLPDFLIDVALLTDADKSDDPNDNDRVSLMTIHSAKGLEFPYVHIVGLEEDLFPNLMSVQTRADLEEERRLFYVALTRAEKRATLSYAMSRYKWGNLTSSEPSRFIEEIDPKYVEMPVQNERLQFGGMERAGSPPWARPGRSLDKPAEERSSSRPVYGRERSAPGIGRPASKPASFTEREGSAPAPGLRKNLKRIAAS